MLSIKALTLSMFAGSVAALTANFDQSNINLSNYMSATFANFSVTNDQYGSTGIEPNTPPNYIQAQGQTAAYGSALGSLLLNTHSTYGHLSSFYIACYNTLAAVPNATPCNFTMAARCLDNKNNPNTFTYLLQYNADAMQSINLASFYQFYANMGYFNGTGSGARCSRYDFSAVPREPGTDQFPVNFYLDTMVYTVTTT